jgi:uncharacterized repeat protein (TIGR02543 family)
MGTYTFPDAIFEYGPQTARTVTVRNTGYEATDSQDIGISGADDTSFTVSKSAIANIGIGANDSFTVAPVDTLVVGTYTAIITVSSTAHGISKQFDVSFRVVAKTYGVSLSGTGTFPTAYEGYGPQRAMTVTVTNTGNQATGALTVGKSGTHAASFTAPDSLASIAVGRTGSFTVVPVADLSAGGTETTYTAMITVNGSNGIAANFNVDFTVTTAPEISLSDTGYDFPPATVGYGAQTAETVTVANTGDKPTGTLTIRKSGTNADRFTVSKTSLPGIAVSGNDSFTVVPAADIPVGTYTATITVSGTNITSKTFDISFTVNPVIYTVTFNAPGNIPATSSAQVIAGNTVSLPPDPGRNGYTFAGWYTTENSGGSKFTGTGVTANITVYARWLSANARLNALSISSGDLDQPFNSNTIAYSVTVLNTVTAINVRATPADGKARYVQYPSANPVSLNVGSNAVRVRVIAEDETTFTDYTITIARESLSGNANLSSLDVDVGTLNPNFSANITAYTVLVPAETPAITVTAAAASGTTVSPSSPHTATLITNSTPITLTVKAENGATRSYTITVNKTAANTVGVSIGIGDEYIDLTRNNGNDLSRELGNALRLRAPDGYESYAWRVDGSLFASATQEIELYGAGYDYGTHSVLLDYTKGGITYGCEVLFRVAR